MFSVFLVMPLMPRGKASDASLVLHLPKNIMNVKYRPGIIYTFLSRALLQIIGKYILAIKE